MPGRLAEVEEIIALLIIPEHCRDTGGAVRILKKEVELGYTSPTYIPFPFGLVS